MHLQTELAQKVAELGGVHKYDLTPDVTHLIVGEYDTLKYRHVARERPDVKAMDAAWVEAVTELWKNDEDIDLSALEREHQLRALETSGAQQPSPGAADGEEQRGSLLVCLTGFGDQRDQIAEMVAAHGGRYTGDLTRKCTHLVVNKPEGKKFVAAKSWEIYTVTLKWLEQTIERGMILEEAKFDPMIPPEEQGSGAWIKRDPRRSSLGKRSRSAAENNAEDGSRKLRKTASVKLNSQKNNLWGDILGRSASREPSAAEEPRGETTVPAPTLQSAEPTGQEGVFADCIFHLHGFTALRADVLGRAITTLGGTVAPSLAAAAESSFAHRLLTVPQSSQPDTHPHTPSDDFHVVTEFYVERCLHNKHFVHPAEHTLGRPFPLFPIPGFADLRICGAAFTGIDLNQMDKSVRQLGAVYEEDFHRTTSVLVCRSLEAVRKDKLRCAMEWGVPVVPVGWLWECINTGYKVPIENFIFPALKNGYATASKPSSTDDVTQKQQPRQPVQRTRSEPTSKMSKGPATGSKAAALVGVDVSGFDRDSPEVNTKPKKRSTKHDSATSADFVTARTHQGNSISRGSDTPLTELSSASLNKSPSPSKPAAEPLARPRAADAKPLSRAASEGPSAVDADLARKQAKAAERQALSSKLTTLIHATSTAAGAAAAAAVDDASSAPRPRRRAILGRAASNASSAADSSHRAATAAPGEDGERDEADAPPATQLEYRDPEAMEYRAAVMSRMEGAGASGGGGGGAATGAVAVTKEKTGLGVAGGRSLRRR